MQQVLHKEQVFLRDSAREGRGWGVQGAPGLGKGIREEFVIWVSSVSLSLYISKLRRGLWGQSRGKTQKEREEWNKPGGHVGPGGGVLEAGLPPWLRWHGPVARRVLLALFSALLVRRLKLPHFTAIRFGHAICFGPRK